MTSDVASNTPQQVDVELIVTEQPAISLGTATALFGAEAGGSDPANQVVNITSSGGGSLTDLGTSIAYDMGDPGGWLTSANLDQTMDPAVMTLVVSITGLADGTYGATVDVTSDVASNSPQQVDVTLIISAQPTISLSTATIAFAAEANGSDPANQVVNITNGGGGSLTDLGTSIAYDMGDPGGWLASAGLDQTMDPAVMTLTVSITGLGAGTYGATVDVTSAVASNSPQQVDVELVVTPQPAISLDMATIAFAAEANGSDPANQVVDIRP